MREQMMFHKVVQDYIHAFRWSRMKQSYPLWAIIYWLLFLPMLSGWEQRDSVGKVMEYWLIAVPILFGFASARLFPVSIRKIMFLCPMDDVERKQYLMMGYYLKVAVTCVVELVALFLSVLLQLYTIWRAAALFFLFLMMMLCVNLETEGLTADTEFVKGTWLINGVAKIVGMLMIVLVAVMIKIEADPGHAIVAVWAVVFVALFVYFLITLRAMRDFQETFEVAIHFENYSILSRKKDGQVRA